MSTHAEILDVHEQESKQSKLRLKPHLAPVDRYVHTAMVTGRPLCVTLEELLTPETVAILRQMKLVP